MSKATEVEVASEVVDPVDKTALAIRDSLDQVEGALTEFDKIGAGLAALEQAHPSNLACDITTAKGRKEAAIGRAAWRDPRIATEKARKAAKAPVIALGKDIDARAAYLTERLEVGESNYDDQVKAGEALVEAEARAKREAETARIESIQERIALIRRTADSAAGQSSADIAAMIAEVEKADVSPAAFEEWSSSADRAKSETLARLKDMHAGAVKHEAEQEQIRKDREELERMRRQQAERDAETARQAAIEAAARAEAERVERERVAAAQLAESQRLAAERAAHEAQVRADREKQERIEAQAAAQRKAADDQARAERQEADRKAAEERAKADRIAREAREAEEAKQAEARAELDRKQAELDRKAREESKAQEIKEFAERAEQQRLKDEAAAAENRRYAAEMAARSRLEKAAPALLSALDRITASYRQLLAGKPVLDATETLAEADKALSVASGLNDFSEPAPAKPARKPKATA